MVALSDSIQELTQLSAHLNIETDDLNDVLAEVESQLAEAGVGITAWLDNHEIEPQDIYFPELQTWGIGFHVLGYTKLDNGWRLAVKEEVRIPKGVDRDGDEKWKRENLATPTPLVNAPRLVRVEAAGLLERLVTELILKARSYLDNIDRAKKVVQE